MSTLREFQSAMAAFVLAPGGDAPCPPGVLDPERLSLHRNNTLATLSESLAGVFPVVRRLVGNDFFRALTNAYVRARPPRSGALIDYGGDFADFVSGFKPAQTLPYLADVAALEWSWHEAFHAADGVALAADALAAVRPDAAGGLRLFLHPSLRRVRSRYPIHRIWDANQPGRAGIEPILLDDGAAHLVVLRPGLDVVLHAIAPGVFDFVGALADGAPLGEACEGAAGRDPAFDPGPALAWLFNVGAVTGFVSAAETTTEEDRS